jgi:hypothetical protein
MLDDHSLRIPNEGRSVHDACLTYESIALSTEIIDRSFEIAFRDTKDNAHVYAFGESWVVGRGTLNTSFIYVNTASRVL